MEQQPDAEVFKSAMRTLYSQYLTTFPHERERLLRLKTCLDGNLEIHLRSVMEGHVTASAVLLSADKTQVLLIHHRALNKWILPGGHYDLEDATLWQCAKRETTEEAGIQSLTLDNWHQYNGTIPLDIDIHAIPARPAKNEGAHYHFDCRFLFRVDRQSSLVIAQRELVAADWKPVHTMQSEPGLSTLAHKIQHIIQ